MSAKRRRLMRVERTVEGVELRLRIEPLGARGRVVQAWRRRAGEERFSRARWHEGIEAEWERLGVEPPAQGRLL